MNRTRERQILDAFVTLSDTLVDDYDVVDIAQRLVDRSAAIFDAASAGLLLADPGGSVEVLASTDEDARLIDLMQLRANAGPCVECFRTGLPVQVTDVRDLGDSWSAFRARALELRIFAVSSVPMRLRGETIGSLNIFRSEPGAVDPDDLAVVQAFADVATIGILHQRALVESAAVRAQLQRALDSRVLIEQAKGANAFAHDITVDEAFERMRAHARRRSLPLTEVARQIVSLELDV